MLIGAHTQTDKRACRHGQLQNNAGRATKSKIRTANHFSWSIDIVRRQNHKAPQNTPIAH